MSKAMNPNDEVPLPGDQEEMFDDCFNAVFPNSQMDEITVIFLRQFWKLSYMQGQIDGKEEQADKMLKMIEEGVN